MHDTRITGVKDTVYMFEQYAVTSDDSWAGPAGTADWHSSPCKAPGQGLSEPSAGDFYGWNKSWAIMYMSYHTFSIMPFTTDLSGSFPNTPEVFGVQTGLSCGEPYVQPI